MPYVDSNTISNPTTGQPILAALGDQWRDNQEYLARNFPHCSIVESTAQSVANSTTVALTSNEEVSDIGGMHSTSSNTSRVTVPAGEGGLYLCSATVQFAANATDRRSLNFLVNGVTQYTVAIVQPLTTAGVPTTCTGARSIVLAAGDYVETVVFQATGGALNVTLLDFTVQWRAVA